MTEKTNRKFYRNKPEENYVAVNYGSFTLLYLTACIKAMLWESGHALLWMYLVIICLLLKMAAVK